MSADVTVAATVGNLGGPLSIEVGLDNSLNYYISSNRTLQRAGFQVVPMSKLVDQISVAVKGQVQAELEVEFLGGLGDAYIRILISDINSMLQTEHLHLSFIFIPPHTSVASVWALVYYNRCHPKKAQCCSAVLQGEHGLVDTAFVDGYIALGSRCCC